jgi:hypothetical protein
VEKLEIIRAKTDSDSDFHDQEYYVLLPDSGNNNNAGENVHVIVTNFLT